MKMFFKSLTLVSILALTGNALANQGDEFSAAMHDLINPPKVQENQGKLAHIKLPEFKARNCSIDIFMGDFRFMQVIDCMNELQAKAVLSPTVENVTNSMKFRQEACKYINPKFCLNETGTKSIDDSSCDDTVSAQCVVSKKVVQLAQSIYLAQSFSHSDEDIHNDRAIIMSSVAFGFNLGLLKQNPMIYQALQDTKNTAYQKAQLDLLVDIDKQLKQLNQKRSNSEVNNDI